MVKRFALSAALVLSIVFSAAAPVAAHVEAGNNGVVAVMHIAPDDNPQAGQPTLIQYYFGGTVTDFSVVTCGCSLEVRKDGKLVDSEIVEPADQTNSDGQVSVTFPDQGVYDLNVAGNAGQTHFTIPFVLRVNPAGGTANTAAGINVVMVSAASLVVVGLLGYYNISQGGRYAVQAAEPTRPVKSGSQKQLKSKEGTKA